MKNKLILFVALLCSACSARKQPAADCQVSPCTMEFKLITAQLISTSGTEIKFKSYKIIDVATGKEVNNRSELPNTQENTTVLVIADDSQLRKLADKGTDLQLQITLNDDKIIKANYKISGGKCACHVSKLEGPDQVDIDGM
ncbi:hypothetical protein LLH06_09845 [Mucilaginibacter daejeonensis]|uniref:hypothetical protein n=1 Tax=Mucilaginibacter daejeonensis TaxID=398049 RepID=UPI001D1779E1|nr:hypothetical protein [Mucilaginibacter daejeonensis]UEG55261.1 hypothetical protein LLH06_09845 [Mucilaginibacter daejeonensis]